MADIYICCICGEEHEDENIYHIDIKGQSKKVCGECVTAIKGLA